MAGKFEIKRAKDGQFYFNLKARNGEIIREHSVIFTLPVIVLDDAQTPDQRCRYTWHNAGLTSGCS
jgi:hypothetical protein